MKKILADMSPVVITKKEGYPMLYFGCLYLAHKCAVDAIEGWEIHKGIVDHVCYERFLHHAKASPGLQKLYEIMETGC